MDMQTRFKERIKRLNEIDLPAAPGLQDYYFLIHERDGKFAEKLGENQIALILQMEKEAESFLPVHGTLRFMYGRIEDTDYPTMEPRVYTRLSEEEKVQQLNAYMKRFGKIFI